MSEPTHRWVADKLGMSVSGVSLLRSGKRNPSMETMEDIEAYFGWPLCDQVLVRHDYPEHLAEAIQAKWDEENPPPIPGQMTIEEIQ